MLAQHGDELLRYARRRVGDPATAEDLVQETFVAALRQIGRFESRSAPRTWLIGILRHKLADHWRAVARRSEGVGGSNADVESDRWFDEGGRWRRPPGTWSVDPAKLAGDREFWSVVARCIESLPPTARAAFSMRVLEAADGEQVRNALGLSATNLGVILHRARLRLRGCLEEHWFNDEGHRRREHRDQAAPSRRVAT